MSSSITRRWITDDWVVRRISKTTAASITPAKDSGVVSQVLLNFCLCYVTL